MVREKSTEDWGQLLKNEWNKRGRSPYRDFFIASFADWDDPEKWDQQARIDVDFLLSGYDEKAIADYHVLEIGCGVGRLVPLLAPQVRSYTGIDVSGVIVREAIKRCRAFKNTRFFETSGTALPAETKGRRYELVFAWAVFIHTPLEVTSSMIASAYHRLVPGGQLRFQLLADPQDLTGLDPDFDLESLKQEGDETARSTPKETDQYIEGHYYYGDLYQYDHALRHFSDLVDGEAEIYRPSPLHLAVMITRPAK